MKERGGGREKGKRGDLWASAFTGGQSGVPPRTAGERVIASGARLSSLSPGHVGKVLRACFGDVEAAGNHEALNFTTQKRAMGFHFLN